MMKMGRGAGGGGAGSDCGGGMAYAALEAAAPPPRQMPSLSLKVGRTSLGMARRASSTAMIGLRSLMNPSDAMRRKPRYSDSAALFFPMAMASGPKIP